MSARTEDSSSSRDHAPAAGIALEGRRCSRCGVPDEVEMLANRGLRLVCQGCDSELETEWVEEDPDNNRHYLDTFCAS